MSEQKEIIESVSVRPLPETDIRAEGVTDPNFRAYVVGLVPSRPFHDAYPFEYWLSELILRRLRDQIDIALGDRK